MHEMVHLNFIFLWWEECITGLVTFTKFWKARYRKVSKDFLCNFLIYLLSKLNSTFANLCMFFKGEYAIAQVSLCLLHHLHFPDEAK